MPIRITLLCFVLLSVMKVGYSLQGEQDAPRFEALLQQAEAAIRQGETERGEALLQQAEEIQPSQPGLLYLLCEAAFARRDSSAAVERANRLLALDLSSPVLYTKLGLLCGRQGQMDCAVSSLQKALDLSPGSPQLTYNLGLAHFARQEFEDTVRVMSALDPIPEDSNYYGLMGNAYMALGDARNAESMLRQAVRVDSANESSQYLLGTLLANQRRYQEAAGTLEGAARACPGSARIELLLGMSRYMTGEAEAAEQHFSQACRLAQDAAPLEDRIAQFYEMVGEPERSLRFYERLLQGPKEKALLYAPRYVDVLFRLGQRSEGQSFLEKTIPEVEKLLSDGRGGNELQLVLGELYFSSGAIREAEEAFRAAYGSQPSAEAAYHLGYFHSRQGNDEQAREFLEEALAGDPSHVPSLVLLGRILVDGAQYDRALVLLQRAQNLQPHNLEVQFENARCHVRREDWASAIPLLEDLVAKQPGHRQAHFFLSKAYMAQGKREKALQQQEIFQRLEKEERARRSKKGAPYRIG